MTKATLRDVPVAELRGRRVLLRADLNVPLEGEHIIDETRIREAGDRVVLHPSLGGESDGDGHRATLACSIRSSQTENPTPGIG